MTDINKITDRASLVFNRDRASNFKGNYFKMHQISIDEIKERLSGINRKFKNIGIITGHPKIWQKAFPTATLVEDSDTLILGRKRYDLIIHALCLHWANDPVGQLIQCKNMLVKDGLFLASLFGGKTLYELNYAFCLAESKISGGISPRFMPMGEIRDLGNILQRAGFGLPVADSLINQVIYKDIWLLMHDLRKMGETNALKSRKKTFTKKQIINKMVSIYFDNFKQSSDTVVATFELIFLTGWCPSDNQQEPLKPGSAKINLGDILDDFTKQTTTPVHKLRKNSGP